MLIFHFNFFLKFVPCLPFTLLWDFYNCSLFIGTGLWKLQTFQWHRQILKTRNSGLLTVSWYNLIISEVNLAKCSGKPPFSEYLRFQSYALEFSNVSNAWTNMWNKMMKEKAGVNLAPVKRQIPRKDSKRMSMPAVWREFSWFWVLLSILIKRWQTLLWNLKILKLI